MDIAVMEKLDAAPALDGRVAIVTGGARHIGDTEQREQQQRQ